ncbi:hypothetical protein Poli38472_008401 [Pythium oligandrum]|uniref:TFIIS central domain-containing protein n=1 Tax=Pythium oligandrum TaxID=41045 RepID=A0A8K1FLZ7_PYTOL|nr:hypothetical protein Poli38472_008401 [Pythium oligandrum]|eukprot:TMW65759.1 hypothetical protein Poli38472_008401 [Pythium oligandrum]
MRVCGVLTAAIHPMPSPASSPPPSTSPDATLSDSEEDETWALELEEELFANDTEDANATADERKAEAQAATTPRSTTKRRKVSMANELPQEVLVQICSFTPVGRVSKAWSLAMSTIARRKFLARLTDNLTPFTSNATCVAQEIESALFTAYGQMYNLPKSYGQKARQLLFNLKDARNSALRERLFSGELPAAALVRMSASNMANPQLVRQREQWIKKRTHEVTRDTRAHEGFTQSDMFECRSCGSHRTCYRQWRRKAIVDRVRVIVLCLDCPYRWEL